MAKIKFLLQSKSETSSIYVRYSVSRQIILKRKTGFVISAKNWSVDRAMPKTGSEDLKALKSNLDKLAIFIQDAHNDSIKKGIVLSSEWLQQQIDIFNNKVEIVELDILTNSIDKFLDNAPLRINQKKQMGLSKKRIGNIKTFKNLIERYEKEILLGKSILIREINLLFVEKFKSWLFEKGYSLNYIATSIKILKTICNDGYKNGIEISPQLKNIKVISEIRPPEQIIYLSEDEQEQIKNVLLTSEELINARKWLLLGCLLGQRGGDLLNITQKNIKEINGMKIIELQQQKTGKLVAIPLLPEAIDIIGEELPTKLSLLKFNEYIKEICKIAGLQEKIMGRKIKTLHSKSQVGLFPKYELVSSHICRRSFATNFYGRIPTPILMNITAHGTEKMFLAYIGKTTYDNAYQMVEYFSKLTPKEKSNSL